MRDDEDLVEIALTFAMFEHSGSALDGILVISIRFG